MNIEFDEKGKFYTEIITKDAIPVKIQTVSHLIEGKVYVRKGDRLIDELTSANLFLAVTDAIIYATADDQTMRCNFMTINKDHIIWLVPLDEI
jgi:hypothetical protein